MDRVNKAIEYHKNGCNCAQAIACAYADILNMDAESAYHITEAYGSGIGGLREICGAVNAGVLVLSMHQSSDSLYEKEKRQETYKKAKEYVEAFQSVDGTYLCGELLDLRKEGKSKFLTCKDCVVKAAELLEDFLKEG